MATQNYKNHIRWYPAHHFIFYPVVIALLAIGIYGWNHYPDSKWLWASVSVIAILLGWLSFMLRQHYALILQNRIVVMEMRFRYYVITGERLEKFAPQLSFGQIAALRFASDEELPSLVKRAVAENLSSKEIKKAIKNWLADENRV